MPAPNVMGCTPAEAKRLRTTEDVDQMLSAKATQSTWPFCMNAESFLPGEDPICTRLEFDDMIILLPSARCYSIWDKCESSDPEFYVDTSVLLSESM